MNQFYLHIVWIQSRLSPMWTWKFNVGWWWERVLCAVLRPIRLLPTSTSDGVWWLDYSVCGLYEGSSHCLDSHCPIWILHVALKCRHNISLNTIPPSRIIPVSVYSVLVRRNSTGTFLYSFHWVCSFVLQHSTILRHKCCPTWQHVAFWLL